LNFSKYTQRRNELLVNAYINLKNELTSKEIVKNINKIESNINEAVPKIDIIFLETANLKTAPLKSGFRNISANLKLQIWNLKSENASKRLHSDY